MRTTTRFSLVALVMLAAGCTLQDTPAPPLTGPSELGLRLSVEAVPDSILQDGASQTTIQIEASGPDGRPVRALALRLDVTVNGTVADFGTLSAKNIVTGDDGRARVTYTAPPRPAEPVDTGTVVTVNVTPIGSDYGAAVTRFVAIRLVTPGVILPPNAPPVASFTFTPTNPAALTTVTFDASTSTDDGRPCGAVCTYRWDFGDGGTSSGIFATYQYRNVGTYQVRLTVTDSRGAASTIAQTITVGAGSTPTASFTFSPTNPAVAQLIHFNAATSTATPPRRIVSWDWDFGNGRITSGEAVTNVYSAAGTYVVTLKVTDDVGQQATTTQSVTVGGSGAVPVAVVTISPTSGTTATLFHFDARTSTPGPGATIERYFFTFGDGTETSNTVGTADKSYVNPGTYVIQVGVRDTAGRFVTTTTTLTVAP